MKRFWTAATVSAAPTGGWQARLDQRSLLTPARAPLIVPTRALADAIADEWNGVDASVDPRAMPLTGLANAAIDRVAPDPAAFADSLARYAASDLVCYRAQSPAALAQRQAEVWDPLLGWLADRHGASLRVTEGLVPLDQDPAVLARLAAHVAARAPVALAGLAPLVTGSGSLVIALAVAEAALEPDAGWAAATIDEAWQAHHWGEDAEAATALAARRADFLNAARFLTLI